MTDNNEVASRGWTTGKVLLITGTADHRDVPAYRRAGDVESVSGAISTQQPRPEAGDRRSE